MRCLKAKCLLKPGPVPEECPAGTRPEPRRVDAVQCANISRAYWGCARMQLYWQDMKQARKRNLKDRAEW